ncbi:hypothetical protein ABB34_08990 [Stenotrophomonas daejeonensis]|uniref:Uncharacterized protein n=1 Tax=Stenotrophomonas daejeonensis TaxID=659018 RepID=A0A0R0DRD7_9GAMM|nr:hypothetical protein ABB34_08990 [Stenotrophomonas daejeonensis]
MIIDYGPNKPANINTATNFAKLILSSVYASIFTNLVTGLLKNGNASFTLDNQTLFSSACEPDIQERLASLHYLS